MEATEISQLKMFKVLTFNSSVRKGEKVTTFSPFLIIPTINRPQAELDPTFPLLLTLHDLQYSDP